jgi:DHA2 family multidrug resistance protein
MNQATPHHLLSRADRSHPLRWYITFAVMLVTIVEILDTTIVNVALPNMMGSLSATAEQVAWILTAYIISSAVVMLLTGFLIARLGQKRLLLINIIGFLICSILCGLATNLTEIVIFRTFQGIFGASLAPLSQFILTDTFSEKDRPKAMAIWGMGIMVAPVLGPTLGGYITDFLSWRWIFYINVPVCLLALYFCVQYITESKREKAKIDWPGLILMTIGVGGLQLFLDHGNGHDWFQSHYIIVLFTLFTLALGFFIWRGIELKQKNIIDLHLFKDGNFRNATLLMTLFSIGVFGVLALQPLFLQNLLHYTTIQTGLIMAPRAIGSMLGMAMAVFLLRFVDPRKIIAIGLIAFAIGSLYMSRFTLNVGMLPIIIATIWQGIGMGLFFVPLSTIAYINLNKHDTAVATGLFNFGRSLGSAIGVSIFITLLTRQTQTNWHQLSGHIQPYNPILSTWGQLSAASLDKQQALGVLAKLVHAQASMISFAHCFFFSAITYLIMLPIVFLMKQARSNKGGDHDATAPFSST